MSAVLDDSQATWAGIFEENNVTYDEAQLSLEDGDVASACGTVPAAAGPFYCPLDEVVYLNFAFYDALRSQYGASGDFAQAYVIAHEVGHHVQTITGVSDKVRAIQAQGDKATGNRAQVAMELQADCYAGVWAAKNRDRLEPGDVEEGMTAAAAIGDDTLTKGRASPETFTHGTSAQRQYWLRRGLQTADPAQCDTFAAGAV